VLDVRNGGRCLIDRLQRALNRLHSPNNVLELAGGGLEVLIEVLQPRGRMTVSREGIVVLGPHPGHVLGLLGQLGAESLGVAPERVQRPLKAQE
jgi:hypothetical protein